MNDLSSFKNNKMTQGMLLEMKNEIRPVGLTVVTNVISLGRLEAVEPSCDNMSCYGTWYQQEHSFTRRR